MIARLLLLLACAVFIHCTASHLHVELKSTWIDTPKIAEIAEFLVHRTNTSLYWTFIERIGEVKDGFGLDLAKDILDESTLSLLKMSLDIRFYSPRVQLQISKTVDQETTVQTSDETIQPLPEDRIFTGADELKTIVYADLGDQQDREFLSKVVREKRSNDESFILRYIRKDKQTPDVNKYMQRDSPYQQKLLNLQGYGVEIALKNMEYKQTDSESQPESFGIDFEKLKKKFSHLSSDLDTFRDHMQKETPKSQKELKVWEMSNFGLQAAYTIMNATDPLEQLRDVSQNFPAHIKSLLRVEFPDHFKTEIQRLQSSHVHLMEGRNPSNQQETIRKNSIYVNGIETDLTKISAFSLYDLVIRESQFMNQFAKWKLDASVMDLLLYNGLPPNTDQEHPRFAIPSDLLDHITWINDIEKDDRYAYNFPPELHTMLQPTYYGQMRFVRRNLLNAVFVFDPFQMDHANKIQEMLQLINRGYPIRVGVLPRVTTDEKSIEFAARFEHLAQQRSPIAALQYLWELQQGGNDLNRVKSIYNNYRGGMPAVEVGKPEHSRMESRRKSLDDELGLTEPSFFMLMNGALFDGTQEPGDQLLMNGIRFEYEKVISLIRENKIQDQDENLMTAVIAANTHYPRYNSLIFGQGKYSILEAPIAEYINNGYRKNTHIVCSADEQIISTAKEFVQDSQDTRIAILDPSNAFCEKLFQKSGIVAASGRVIELEDSFSIEDWKLLEEFEPSLVGRLLNKDSFGSLSDERKSDAIFNLNSILSDFKQTGKERSKIQIHNDITKLEFNRESTLPVITAILNPLSLDCQRFVSILQWLVQYKYPVTVYLNPLVETSNMPLKSYYRYVLASPSANFDNITTRNGEIYTLRMDVPESWLIESIYAEQDLDNLNLYSDCAHDVCQARFQLEHLVITGTCYDKTTRRAPRGLQLELSKSANVTRDVTLVMANLGYFQLKSDPGVWNLELPEGRHSEIYELESVNQVPFYEQSMNLRSSPPTPHRIIVNDFDAPFTTVHVLKKVDEELLQNEEESGSLWNYFKRDDKEKVIHIFSLASGHMYERLLKIMIRSVTKHIQRPNTVVKFWFLKQFLSPGFKTLLPYLAEHFKFKYGLVSYQWPHWLHKQEQKQRLIWAYKVLFLDVLFPLREVHKIIFVDADQICRTDMSELFYDLDMEGKSLAYTPFCDSRQDMAGFQFWKQGYWVQHLRGLPYHISALYVVDVSKFRKEYHGDQFRMFYDNLARDPNSLSNLDQDLPNYAQHMVPIRSLPQEWLWCETWCSDQSKPRAKTIDLCNNPQTKEHKLASARRIIPEWTGYDDEIKEFEKTLTL